MSNTQSAINIVKKLLGQETLVKKDPDDSGATIANILNSGNKGMTGSKKKKP